MKSTILSPEISQEINSMLKPIDKATGMSSHFYLNESYLKNERDLIFASSWAALSLLSDLPKKGYVKPIDFYQLPLLISHDNDGVIRVFHNVCRHRGMKLVEKEQLVEAVIRCPYHAWTYTIDGKLQGTPNFAGMGKHECPSMDKGKFGLKEVSSHLFMQTLFINLDGKAPDFESYIKPLKTRLQTLLGQKGWSEMCLAKDGHRISMEVDCNWKLAVENYAEAYHLPVLHAGLNASSPLDEHEQIMINENFAGQVTHGYARDDESQHLQKFSQWPLDKEKQGEYMIFYPNLLTGIQNNHAFVILLQPVNSEQTIEHVEIFYVGDEAASDQKYQNARADTLAFWTEVFSEDIIAVEGMQKGRVSPSYDGGIYAQPLEVLTHHFHQWVAKKLKPLAHRTA